MAAHGTRASVTAPDSSLLVIYPRFHTQQDKTLTGRRRSDHEVQVPFPLDGNDHKHSTIAAGSNPILVVCGLAEPVH